MKNERPIRVSGLRFDKPVGKRLDRLADGTIGKTPQLGERAKPAFVINEAFTTAAEAFDNRLAADDATTMFFSGTFDPGFATEDKYRSVPSYALPDARRLVDAPDWHTIICATKDFLAFRTGPSLLRIDVDVKRADEVAALWPEEPFGLKTVGDVLDAVTAVIPEAFGCPTMVAPSSGSMIVDAETGEVVKGPGGWRVIIVIDDATRIPDVLETIHLRCWARGEFRYAFTSRKSGSFYTRSLADQALNRPTQPDYVVADLGPGLARAPGVASVFDEDGPYLVASSILLAGEDRALAEANIAAARAELAPAAKRLRATAIKEHADELVKKGVPQRTAERAAVRKFEGGLLLGSDFIQLDDGEAIPASGLLTEEGRKYDGRLCRDPVEPEYDGGRAVGRIYWNDGLRPGVHSFAHGSKFWRVAHDAETASAAMDAAGADGDALALILARLDGDELDHDQLETQAAKLLRLGSKRQPLRAVVERQRQRIAAYAREHAESDDETSAEHAGPVALDVPLKRHSFPRIETTQNGIRVIDHVDNIDHMLRTYGVGYRYNVISKAIEWDHPGIRQGGDNAETVLYSAMLSLCALNKVPINNLSTHLTALAARNEFNPVVNHLAALKWDGKPRFDALVDAMEPDDSDVSRIALRLFLVQACAAADNAERARQIHPDFKPTFEGCLVPVGEQGIGKTKGLRNLLPRPLRCYFKEGHTLDLRNKDSVGAAVGAWMVELGELEGTFKRSDIAELKAFISRDVDEIRMPYARKSSKFARRSVYAGTVNDLFFLADETGNRRFWPVTVGKPNPMWSDDELDQLWAEAWSRYAGGEKWWPAAGEERLLAENAERYRFKSAVEEAIEKHFQWGRRPDWEAGRHTASEIYAMLAWGAGIGPLTAVTVKSIGAAVNRLWRESGVVETQGGVLVVADRAGDLVKVNACGGKNRGWLLPPTKASGMKSVFTVMDGGKAAEED